MSARTGSTKIRSAVAFSTFVALGAFGVVLAPASSGGVPAGVVVVVSCPGAGVYTVVTSGVLDDYAPMLATDGTTLVPKSYGEVTVTQSVDGTLTQVGTLSPSSRKSAERNPQIAACSFIWSRSYSDQGHDYRDTAFGSMSAVISGP